jgi:hypothetical protein
LIRRANKRATNNERHHAGYAVQPRIYYRNPFAIIVIIKCEESGQGLCSALDPLQASDAAHSTTKIGEQERDRNIPVTRAVGSTINPWQLLDATV